MKKLMTLAGALLLAFGAQAQTAAMDTVVELSELEIVSSRTDSKSPFAVTNLPKKDIVNRLASRDLPNVLNTAPSIYSTNQGGGAGDSRLNVRGFNQRNVAIMINGVPVNDMENGWVYWSNWDGVGDATSNIQIQRGLSGVNLAVPSIGGTINIISDPAARSKGGYIRQELGSWNFLKTSVGFNSGMIGEKLAISGTLVRKTGDGFYQGTWTDAYAYYLGASYQASKKDKIELYAIGAPQRHGQNLYRQNVGRYSKDYALSLDGYDPNAADQFSELGRNYSQNYNAVDPSYEGEQYYNMYGARQGARYNSGYINERENYFHKPQVNLNWYRTINDNMRLANIFYFSGGSGGGSGTLGSVKSSSDLGFARNWDAEVAENADATDGSPASTGILRNSINNQWTLGAISKLYHEVNDNLNITYGLDVRTAQVEHAREVRDLLGGEYYVDNSSDFRMADYQAGLGDKVAYHNTTTINWFGAYIQGDYRADRLSANGVAGVTMASYTLTDHFRDNGNGEEYFAENKNLPGVQIKGGAKYAINDNVNAFANLGWVKATPTFDKAINDASGKVYEQSFADNETFNSYEAGLNWSAPNGKLALSASYYYTLWLNRTNSFFVNLTDGSEDAVYLTGMDAKHSGLEFEAAWKPIKGLRVDLSASFGDWTMMDDVTGEYTDYATGSPVTTQVNYYLKGLHIGDAPQNQQAMVVSYTGVKNLNATLTYRNYSKYYADWNVFGRNDAADRAESWEVPNFSVLDLNLNYRLPIDFNGVTMDVFAHIFNVMDAVYIQDATDNSAYNAYGDKTHSADDAEVFLGLPRNYNAGVKINF
ncbi:MAG: TonB-dependent receptor plug domain-containing protein [Schleiferiaceae bacterium]|nr:TonB-dependent receptor plug domain-containing protein [Schleiferiaceae bacterium]